MSLSDDLLATSQARLKVKAEAQIPKAWRASERRNSDGSTEVTSRPYEGSYEASEAALLEDHGYDPNTHRIAGGWRESSWTAYKPQEYRRNTEEGDADEDLEAFTFTAKAFKFKVEKRPTGRSANDVEELVKALDGRTPIGFALPPSVDDGFGILAIGDTQIAKVDSPINELTERITQVFDHVRDGGKRYKHLHLAWLGDCIEGDQSQGGSLRWRTTLTMTEQVRMLQRLMMYAIEQLAPIADRLTVSSVPGNHDNANKRDLQTRVDDSWAIQALVSVEDALSMSRREDLKHVECYVPGPDQHSVVMEVGGLLTAMTHGDQWRGPAKGLDWWRGQAFGGQPEGEARLLLNGHYHHFRLEEQGDRMQVVVPAMEHESIWWKHKTGTGGNPGALLIRVNGGKVASIERLHPWAQ